MAKRDIEPRTVRAAIRALKQPGRAVGRIDSAQAEHPGLYALYGSAATWRELHLGNPPDGRPLYVGKSESTLAKRDLEGHFGITEGRRQSPTGSSTVRRSLAAMLAPRYPFRGVPRNPEKPSHFANYGLRPNRDEELSAWMRRRLKISLWPHDAIEDLEEIETAVLRELLPPLNLTKVQTPWLQQVKDARAILAGQARRSGR